MGDRDNAFSSGAASGEPEILCARGISKSFGGNLVLDDFHIALQAGENVAILGRSGSGKSVFLKIVAGLLEPDRGEIRLWGRDVRGLSFEEWAPLRRRMGFVFQSGALFDSMTVFENVAFPLIERRIMDEKEIRRIVGERLEWVELPGIGDLYPSALSGGMRRRVALARTLASDPEFILYDEPTAGLDPVTGRKIATLMRILDRKLGTTSIVVTHDIECARTTAERWAFLSRGRILADGTPQDLLGSKEPEVLEFLAPRPGEHPA